jgi:MinD-like ATPase involved in chromosome partitioning or flagellar assembly
MHDDRTRLAQDVERELRGHFPALVFDTVIPRSVRVAEAPSYGVPVVTHAPSSRGSEAYMELAEELARRERSNWVAVERNPAPSSNPHGEVEGSEVEQDAVQQRSNTRG